MKTVELEKKEGGFRCCHCGQWVPFAATMGTRHRNHCRGCLWSKHVDCRCSGDRGSPCHCPMEPLGLTFKHEGVDKYGNARRGELMLIHCCSGCEKLCINRIAGDDSPEAIVALFQTSQTLVHDKKERIAHSGIRLIAEGDRREVFAQLFGTSGCKR